MLTKILIWFSFFYFVVISACASTPQYFQVWNVYNTRLRLFKERMKIAYWWIIKFSIFATILFIFFRYSISASTKYPPILVSQLIPTAGEIIFILIIMMLSLIAIYTMPYWCVARYIKIKRWDAETKLFKVDLKSLIIAFIPVFFLVLVALITDLLYVHMRLGLSLGSVQFLEPLLASYGGYLLLLEVIILLIADIGTYIDGKRQIRSRKTFVTLPLP